MDKRDYYLLKYLSQFNGSAEIDEDKVSDEVKNNLEFMGLDINRHPNSIWVRLFLLEKQKLVKEISSTRWEITPFGREQLRNLHFELFREPLPHIILDTSISEACEIIFKEHIERGSVMWTGDAFELNWPKNGFDALNKMLHEGILFKTDTHPDVTMIASDYENAKSYEEAKQIRQAAKDKPLGYSINMRDGIAMIGDNQSNRDLAAFNPTHNPPTAPTIAETKQGSANAVIKFILNNIVLVILLAIIGGLIVAYFSHWFGWNK
jgi:hypothetical protein